MTSDSLQIKSRAEAETVWLSAGKDIILNSGDCTVGAIENK